MYFVEEILYRALQIYVIVIIAQILLSFFPSAPGTATYRVNVTLRRLTDPVFMPLRRIIPPIGFGGAALDLSPLVVLLVIELILMPLVRP
ncbi:MAG: YggT family protein [Actinomycetota bacterium]|nr:YggT family protein [Actinomycetota bacterium]